MSPTWSMCSCMVKPRRRQIAAMIAPGLGVCQVLAGLRLPQASLASASVWLPVSLVMATT